MPEKSIRSSKCYQTRNQNFAKKSEPVTMEPRGFFLAQKLSDLDLHRSRAKKTDANQTCHRRGGWGDIVTKFVVIAGNGAPGVGR